MVALLKAKSKVILNKKSRTTYNVADVFPKRKIQPESQQSISSLAANNIDTNHVNTKPRKVTANIIEKYEHK